MNPRLKAAVWIVAAVALVVVAVIYLIDAFLTGDIWSVGWALGLVTLAKMSSWQADELLGRTAVRAVADDEDYSIGYDAYLNQQAVEIDMRSNYKAAVGALRSCKTYMTNRRAHLRLLSKAQARNEVRELDMLLDAVSIVLAVADNAAALHIPNSEEYPT